MSKTAVLNVRMDPQLKHQAERVYRDFGISLSDAVNIFLNKSVMVGGLPFDMRQPRYSAETLAAFQEAEEIASGRAQVKSYATAQEMIEDILAEDDGDAET